MAQHKIDVINGSIPKVLIQLTWPMMFGMLGLMVFNLTDTFYIGKLGVEQLAAISFTFPVIMFINSLALGMGIGTASLISRSYVSESKSVVQKYAVDAIFLAVFVVVTSVIIGLFTIEPVFKALGVTDELMPFVKDYMQIWFWGVPFVVVPMVGNNIMRATGDTFTPGMIMVFSALVNVILDPIMIFGFASIPAMGIKGAALATVVSRAIGFVAAIYILTFREKLLILYIPKVNELMTSWKKILYVAAPAAAGMLITPISIGIITRFVSEYGKEAIAAFGIVSRVEMLILMIIMALGSVITIFSGQNWSINKHFRVKSAYQISVVFAMAWAFLLFIICQFFSPQLARIFNSDEMVVKIASDFLIIVSLSYGFQGIIMLSGSLLNGINKPMIAMVITLLRMVVLYVPLAWILSKYFGLTGIFWAAFISNIATGIYAFIRVNGNFKAEKTSTLKAVFANFIMNSKNK